MKESIFFEETKPAYIVVNEAFRSIKSKGFYNAIFTDKYEALDEDDKNMVVGIILGDYGLTTKELIDTCFEEKAMKKINSYSVVNGVVEKVTYKWSYTVTSPFA